MHSSLRTSEIAYKPENYELTFSAAASGVRYRVFYAKSLIAIASDSGSAAPCNVSIFR